MKFIIKLQRFMYGRYGMDDLSKFIFKIYVVLLLLNIFIRFFILSIIEILLIIILFYRILSKKIYNRNKENMMYLKLKKLLFKPLDNIKRNKQDKNHVYKKCKHCKKILKLPLPDKRGIKKVKCPNCKKRIRVITLKKQKIEIIKKTRKSS